MAQSVRATVKALWWGAAGGAARLIVQPSAKIETTTPKPSLRRVRAAYLEAFAKDNRDVATGLYPALEDRPTRPLKALARAMDFLQDARLVDQRRRRGGGTEVRAEAPSTAYPTYYRQNFHYQTGGWFTADSAKRYDAQVEALFSGTAAAMRRRVLSVLMKALKDRDQRGLTLVDLACGSGGFLRDLACALPKSRILGLDLSKPYLDQARKQSEQPVIQAQMEQLPFADNSLDAVTCIYLFHELPPRYRPLIAAEMARVLKPGGWLAFGDSIQPADEPDLQRLLEAFPAFFHEPYYESYAQTDLIALFAEAGLVLVDADQAFLTKALLFQNPMGLQADQ
jgi:ubiquinone/menaquinone biosynthesis C-methylase UbiE